MSVNASQHYYQGGYNYSFVDESVPNRYLCAICLLCQRNPHQTSCGHRFCHSCILTWLNEGKTCPKDNSSLGEGDLYPDHIANREILQLMVKCPNHTSGCKSVLKVSDVENHLPICANKDVDQNSPKPAQNVMCQSCGEVRDL